MFYFFIKCNIYTNKENVPCEMKYKISKQILFNSIKVVALYNLYLTNELVVANMGNTKYNLFIK